MIPSHLSHSGAPGGLLQVYRTTNASLGDLTGQKILIQEPFQLQTADSASPPLRLPQMSHSGVLWPINLTFRGPYNAKNSNSETIRDPNCRFRAPIGSPNISFRALQAPKMYIQGAFWPKIYIQGLLRGPKMGIQGTLDLTS